MFYRILINACLIAMACSACAQLPPARAHMNKAHKQTDFKEPLRDPQLNTVYWQRDYLIAYQKQPSSNSFAAALYDEDGRLVTEVTFWIDGAEEVQINSVTVTKLGELILTGHSVSEKHELAGFIAKADSSGKITHLIRTNPVIGFMACASGDSVWIIGRNRERADRQLSYPVLYEYNFAKGLLFSALDRETVDSQIFGEFPWLTLHCNDSQVSILLKQQKEAVTLELPSRKITRTKFTGLEDPIHVTGVALTDSNDLFVSIVVPDQSGAKREDPKVGVFHFEQFADGTGGWSPLTETIASVRDETRPVTLIVGSQGKNLIFTKGRADTSFSWAAVAIDGSDKVGAAK